MAPQLMSIAGIGVILLMAFGLSTARRRIRLRVVGAACGRAYVFSAERPVQAVARADAQALLGSRFFGLA